MAEGTIVTFYSYKGGVGRTLALANIGAVLAKWGYRVLCVDWDLEAPGLHLYYDRWIAPKHENAASQKPGLTELILNHVAGEETNWKDHLHEVVFPDVSQPLKLMTAGRQDETYVSRMQSLDWKTLYESHQLGNFLEQLRTEWKNEFDFILLDSRTGVTDISGICTVQMPDSLVVLFTANLQSLHGCLDVVQRAKRAQQSLPFDRGKLLALPVATRFELKTEYEQAQSWLKTFAEELEPVFAEWAHKDVTAAELLNYTRVPYIPYWSFGEKLPVIDKGSDDAQDIGYSFETLTALLAQGFANSDLLVSNRDAYVQSTAARGMGKRNGSASSRQRTKSKGVRVILSYSHRDLAWADLLSHHLHPLMLEGSISELFSFDTTTRPGDQRHLLIEVADIFLPLISADYLASDFIYDIEMRRIFERNERNELAILPIILRPVSWQGSLLGKFQVLPKSAKPVSKWEDTDEAMVDIVEAIRHQINARGDEHSDQDV
ncbi:MAG: AAA family ATPase [Acidobacteria bacterium]|nr:AAA family ATPase [Acidobacteriota bacterium]